MAGHSQFKNIMHRKAAQDKKRAKIYTKLIRDIMTAAKAGGDVSANPSLRSAVEKARKENMTKDVVERAIKRGTGEIAGADYAERTYEGYGPAGVAVMVTTLTDNPTRTITNVRTAFSKHGGNVGSDGAVAWMFKHVGLFSYPSSVGDEEKITEAALNAGADDVQNTGEGAEAVWEITCASTDFASVKDALEKTLGMPAEANLTYVPTQTQTVTELETAQSIVRMVEMLEADDDVQTVTTNLDLPPDLAARLH